jgi:hypothetical protein
VFVWAVAEGRKERLRAAARIQIFNVLMAGSVSDAGMYRCKSVVKNGWGTLGAA